VVGVLGGHHHLGGLFADLLQEGVRALVQQARDVALVGVAAVGGLAAFDDGGQSAERGSWIRTRESLEDMGTYL
jgi:hypothetical protein